MRFIETRPHFQIYIGRTDIIEMLFFIYLIFMIKVYFVYKNHSGRIAAKEMIHKHVKVSALSVFR
ncbi:hypothetical protein D9E10_04465 [Escherichia coli]|nr:hypothetical protein [Escherichia coli]